MKPLMSILVILMMFPMIHQDLNSQELNSTNYYTENVRGHANESFEVYYPNGYEKDRVWPVLFIFDPMGHGGKGMLPFRKAADEFGYLLIASNTARNGLHSENFNIASRLMNQVIEDYLIDSSRMYVAGFSGGSRLASAIAVLSKQFAGVIGCGSGFSPNTSEKPNFETFSYAGVVGNLDMNYSEMQKNTAWLDKFNVSNHLFVFDGGHQWPAEDEILRVFGWLEKEAQRKKLIQNFVSQKDNILDREITHLRSLVDKKDFILASKTMDRIQQNYSSNIPAEIISAMPSGKEIDKQLLEESKILSEEISEITKINDSYFKHSLEKVPLNRLKFWRKKIQKLQQQKSSDSELESQHAQRLLRHIQAIAFESGIGYGNAVEDKQKALFSVQILLLIQPENARYQKWLAQLEKD